MNFCRDITVGKGAGERRKLLRMDSSDGAMIAIAQPKRRIEYLKYNAGETGKG